MINGDHASGARHAREHLASMEPLIVINGDVAREALRRVVLDGFNGAVDRDQRRHDRRCARDGPRRRASMEPLIVINGDTRRSARRGEALRASMEPLIVINGDLYDVDLEMPIYGVLQWSR